MDIEQQVDAERGATDEKIKQWIERSKKAEEKLDFNSHFREFNGHVNATWDRSHILSDAISASTQFTPSNPPGFHGRQSQSMVGSTVPGKFTNEYRVIALRTFPDNKPDALSDTANRPSAHFAQLPQGLDDGGDNKDLVKALQKMLKGADSKKQDIDVREFGKYRGWRSAV